MRIAIASDHAGFVLKESLLSYIEDQLSATIQDLGTHVESSCDYPDFAVAVARAVIDGQADLGILICGTGIGMSIAANKVTGARAALCGDSYSARMARAHNDANILCLGGRVIGPAVAEDITKAFLTTEPIAGVEKYTRRREQVTAIEKEAHPNS